jgi:serine/threonine protein kinase
MPSDSDQLRADLFACFPSVVIDGVAKESGQRVVYFAHFDDTLIPPDLANESNFLHDWQSWGRVVVKLVSGAGATAITRLQAEVSLLNELKSPQFPKLLYSNYFTENPITDDPLDENLYISIEEFVESLPLSNKLDCYVGNPTEVFRIARSVVCGLRPLWEHPRKFVHRDVKPDNLLLKPDGEIVIIDFGIVRETGAPGITKEGVFQAPASFGYAAPEHLANDKDLVSFKTDVFSLGVVMYELISGQHPFLTRNNMDLFEIANATDNSLPTTLMDLGVANKLESDVVARMMEKKPYLRPRTISLLLDDLNLNKAN